MSGASEEQCDGGSAVDAPHAGVRRIRAPNAGPMTGDGTNTYLVGHARVAVIDPGPDEPRHRAALLDAVGGRARVEAILITHAHLDHTAGATALARAVGAPIVGYGRAGAGRSETMRRLAAEKLGGGEGADDAYAPSERLVDGGAIETDEWRIEALHTPGHTSDHLSFHLAGADILFTGDLVMGWSTSLVSPPDGDMGAFMRSLDRLAARPDQLYLPGHGEPVTTPQERVAELIAHRRMREAQILEALRDGPADAQTLVARLYADVDPKLHGMAARNVLAHLIDLWERDMAAPVGDFSAQAAFALA